MKNSEGTFPRNVAKTYNNIMTYFDYDLNAIIMDEIVKKFLKPLPESPKVLEIGIGTGNFSKRLNDMCYDTYGIDDSDGMITELNKKYPYLKAVVQNVKDLNLKIRDFDIILSAAGPLRFNYYENERIFESYLPNRRQTNIALEKVYKHLRSGGLFIMSQNSDPEHPGFFKSTGDDMNVHGGLKYEKREWRDDAFLYKDRKLINVKNNEELWNITHKFSWCNPEEAEKRLRKIGFKIIGFDKTDSYHISIKE